MLSSKQPSGKAIPTRPVLVIHGGAGPIPDKDVQRYKAGLVPALRAGWLILMNSGTALDACTAAIEVLENNPAYDAGIGSYLDNDGNISLDAGIMEGDSLNAGAVAGVSRIANPIRLARHVVDSDNVLLIGEGAEKFALSKGMTLCNQSDLITDEERERWLLSRSNASDLSAEKKNGDTVGAIAIDVRGCIAAGTSTGGRPNRCLGRVGDSPIIGSGYYADSRTGACSTTGWGEEIMKVVLAKKAIDFIETGLSPRDAAVSALEYLKSRLNSTAGCITLDRFGNIGIAFNTPRMAYGWCYDLEQVFAEVSDLNDLKIFHTGVKNTGLNK